MLHALFSETACIFASQLCAVELIDIKVFTKQRFTNTVFTQFYRKPFLRKKIDIKTCALKSDTKSLFLSINAEYA